MLQDKLNIRVFLQVVHVVFTGMKPHINPGTQKQAKSDIMKMWISFASEPLCRLLTLCTYIDYLVSQGENNNGANLEKTPDKETVGIKSFIGQSAVHFENCNLGLIVSSLLSAGSSFKASSVKPSLSFPYF